jgi:hypothetical protein
MMNILTNKWSFESAEHFTSVVSQPCKSNGRLDGHAKPPDFPARVINTVLAVVAQDAYWRYAGVIKGPRSAKGHHRFMIYSDDFSWVTCIHVNVGGMRNVVCAPRGEKNPQDAICSEEWQRSGRMRLEETLA